MNQVKNFKRWKIFLFSTYKCIETDHFKIFEVGSVYVYMTKRETVCENNNS